MADWPIESGQAILPIGIVSSGASRGTAITASSTTNTKGVYAELISSLDYTIKGFWLVWSSIYEAYNLLDLAIGASGSETIVISNFSLTGLSSGSDGGGSLFIPLKLAKNQRLSARIQSTIGGAIINLALYGVNYSTNSQYYLCEKIETIGVDTANSRGLTLATPSTSNTKTTYTEISSSSPISAKGVIITVGSFYLSQQYARMDIATGGSGSETLKITDHPIGSGSGSGIIFHSNPIPFKCNKSDRISIRAAINSSATTHYFQLLLLGG